MRMERQITILSFLRNSHVVQIKELSERLGVSQNTIRRDLKRLEEGGLVTVTHGGAVGVRNAPMGMPLDIREDQYAEEKLRIGRKAAELVRDGEAVILDAGTTTERIVPGLKDRKSLTVITNGLNIALSLQGIPGITALLVGGVMNETTGCTAGFYAEEFLRQFHVNTAFVSAGGVTTEGVMNTNAFEVRIKRSMIQAADKVVLVVTGEKIGKNSLAPFAGLEEIDMIITDSKASEEEVESFRRKGVEVVLC
jgi:DeoR/GlpR family transcriptional regulator of sugar metabolism